MTVVGVGSGTHPQNTSGKGHHPGTPHRSGLCASRLHQSAPACRRPLEQVTKDLGGLRAKRRPPKETGESLPSKTCSVRLQDLGFRPRRNRATFVRGCSIANALDGFEEGDLQERPDDIGTTVPKDPDEPRNKCVDRIFGSDSEEPFDGIDSD